MLTKRLLSRNFATYNPLKAVANMLRAPIKHIKYETEPDGLDKQSWGNTTAEGFDEVSQEWQAMIVANTYDQHTQQYLDAHTQPNFGTIDNPHVIVTSDAPFRYFLKKNFLTNIPKVCRLLRSTQRGRLRRPRVHGIHAA
jgi:hypothetical protein